MLEKIVADKADVNSPDLQNRGSFLVVVGPKRLQQGYCYQAKRKEGA